jgi:poly(3-hydroxybutyrate) depolymerase
MGRIKFHKTILVAALLTLGGATAVAQELARGVEKKTIGAGVAQQSYYLFVPDHAKKDPPMPLIVLVHGAGGSGLDQLEAWRSLAERHGIILLAPNIRNSAADWDQLYDHPEWIRDAVNEVGRKHPVDGRRMYLWGYSAGCMFSFYFAFLESRYFAAAAVHGGVIENFKFQMADFAVRKVPFAYYIGTKDQWWTVQQTRATRDALTARAFPVHYVELNGADHRFFMRAEEITSDAWKYMKQFALDKEPQFDPLDLEKIKSDLR